MPYPITTEYEDRIEGRDRITTAFRLILAIPHMILVGAGGPSGGFNNAVNRGGDTFDLLVSLVATGVLNIALGITSFLSWFVIIFTGRMPETFWNFAAFVLGWQFRVNSYLYLLCDEYPPFGDAPPDGYPARFAAEQPRERNRLTVFFRLFLVIPHAIVLFFLGIAAAAITIAAWFAILFTGAYPAGLYGFASGVLAWSTRVSAYLALLTDEYPPFSLERSPAYGPPAPAATTSA